MDSSGNNHSFFVESNNNSYHLQNSEPSSGLLRLRSAPSLLLSGNNQSDTVLRFQELEEKPAVAKESRVGAGGVSYGSSLPCHYPRQNGSSGMDSSSSSYGLFGFIGSSSLSSQNSSPAGAFGTHHLNVHNGYATLKGVGNYTGGNHTSGEESTRLKNQLSFSPRIPSSFGMLSQISEAGNESIGVGGGKFGSGIDDTQFFSSSGVPYCSWNDTRFAESFNGMKRDQQKNGKLFSGTENGLIGDRMHLSSQHLSLPKTSAEMVGMEKFFHFQDTTPCKIRAKRGCATHPRSIAERVRRTRISERMRKLQELVPNMEKQTNTADMLDLAVEYIKDLQNQYKTLRENRANCKCSSKQKPVQNQIV